MSSIKSLGGNIMDVAPDKVEAIAIWIRSGFNARNSIWRFDIPQKGIKLKLVSPLDKYVDSNEPWLYEFDTIWEIIPERYQKLKYIYVFANPLNSKFVTGLERLDSIISTCLNNLNQLEVSSVAMIHIPASTNAETTSIEDDEKSANRMIAVINDWIANNKSNFEVFLVDNFNHFENLVK